MSVFRIAATRLAPVVARTALSTPAPRVVPQVAMRAVSSVVTTTPAGPETLDKLGSVDHMYEEDRIDKVAEPERRAFTYLMLSGVRFSFASLARFLVIRAVATMSASAEVLAAAFAEFDLSKLEQGELITVSWRGKPIFIRRLTPAQLATTNAVNVDTLRDPESLDDRTLKPEFVVLVGICPHLGCVPGPGGDFEGWLCPCHGSHFDSAGRIRRGPAPLNLEVPPYKFIEEHVIMLG